MIFGYDNTRAVGALVPEVLGVYNEIHPVELVLCGSGYLRQVRDNINIQDICLSVPKAISLSFFPSFRNS